MNMIAIVVVIAIDVCWHFHAALYLLTAACFNNFPVRNTACKNVSICTSTSINDRLKKDDVITYFYSQGLCEHKQYNLHTFWILVDNFISESFSSFQKKIYMMTIYSFKSPVVDCLVCKHCDFFFSFGKYFVQIQSTLKDSSDHFFMRDKLNS